jgi:CcmD family protein
MKNLTFLVAAYMVIWGGLFFYLIFVSGQQRKLTQRVKVLEELLKEKERQ